MYSTNFKLWYGDLSKRVMNTIKTEVNQMKYSIDEAFLDFSDFADEERAFLIKKKFTSGLEFLSLLVLQKLRLLLRWCRIISQKGNIRKKVFLCSIVKI